jgi:hypothetical protein
MKQDKDGGLNLFEFGSVCRMLSMYRYPPPPLSLSLSLNFLHSLSLSLSYKLPHRY